MNAQEYIASGAIEACVMGLADEQDWLELEQMVSLYPEVKAYKEKLELDQEKQHLADAAFTPPPAIRQAIFSQLTFEKETPVISLPDEKAAASKPQVVPILPTPKPMKWLQRAVAVSVILLMGSIILNFYFYSKAVTYKNEKAELLAQQNSLLAKSQAMEASFKTLKNPDVKPVVMDATPGKAGAMATVFWDHRTKDVYLMVNNLPQHTTDQQYQLWAIVDGKPVDAGMVDMNANDTTLIKMHNIPNAQAFAITLEKKGGSPAPNLDALYVMGKV